MIVLSACGLEFKWKFPQYVTKCPVQPCSVEFGSRSDAIDHFKETHAYRSTLCPICKKPVVMRSFGDIKYHYKKQHPHADLPPYFEKLSVRGNKGNQYAEVKSETKSWSENGSKLSNQANANVCIS